MAAVSNRVIVRSNMGRFISACHDGARETAKDLVEMGAQMSRELAPVGSKHDMRTIPLRQSISHRMVSATAGVWESSARHALHQEFGTGPHTMIGSPFFRFYWEAAGRMWEPGLYGEPDIINHPGHGPQPFLRPAYEMVMARAMAVARANFPG